MNENKRIKIGAGTFLYPMPVVIVGSLTNQKPNFTTVSYCGIIHTAPPLLSITLSKARHSLKGIIENKTFSINIPSVSMVEKTDYVGMFSGKNIDKSDIFNIEYGTLNNVPLISEAPISMECKVYELIDLSTKSIMIIGEIVETHADKKIITGDYPDITKMKPLVYTMKDLNYWNIGDKVGKAFDIGKKLSI